MVRTCDRSRFPDTASGMAAKPWPAAAVREVRTMASAAVADHTRSHGQRELLAAILAEAFAPRRGGIDSCALASTLPLLIHAGLRGRDERCAQALAAAVTLIEAGIYTLDHILDGEMDGALRAVPPRAVLLGAVDLISHVPQAVLAALDVSDSVVRRLLAELYDGMARISAGQLADLAPGSLDGPAVRETIAMKTGARRALYAGLAARLAGADDAAWTAATGFGRALGCARQISSDLVDLVGPQPSRDLAAGTVTLPIALHLDDVDDDARQELRALLARARTDETAHALVRTRLHAGGALRRAAAAAMAECVRAREHLVRLDAAEPAATLLRALVEQAAPAGLPVPALR